MIPFLVFSEGDLMVSETYPRNLVGYGRQTPDPKWPDEARIAVQFVINYEEGGESSILDGDPASENLLSEIVGAAAWPGCGAEALHRICPEARQGLDSAPHRDRRALA
jgi:hypothetical protein